MAPVAAPGLLLWIHWLFWPLGTTDPRPGSRRGGSGWENAGCHCLGGCLYQPALPLHQEQKQGAHRTHGLGPGSCFLAGLLLFAEFLYWGNTSLCFDACRHRRERVIVQALEEHTDSEGTADMHWQGKHCRYTLIQWWQTEVVWARCICCLIYLNAGLSPGLKRVLSQGHWCIFCITRRPKGAPVYRIGWAALNKYKLQIQQE